MSCYAKGNALSLPQVLNHIHFPLLADPNPGNFVILYKGIFNVVVGQHFVQPDWLLLFTRIASL